MPCGDISEHLALTLDHADALRTYTLRKRTCGTAIGTESLLLPWLGGMSLDEILVQTPATLRAAFDDIPADMEFVYAKHLEVLQQGLLTLGGGGDDRCVALAVTASEAGIGLEALVQLGDPSAPVVSCGGCGRCGAKAKRAARTASTANRRNETAS